MTDSRSPNQHNIDAMLNRMQIVKGVSPSMCLAKWLQATIYLHNGRTHSCHHPPSHTVPLEELHQNPAALHNTIYKKAQRDAMLKGEYPEECEYCWNIEGLEGQHISDRVYKSTETWAFPQIDDVIRAGSTDDIDPSYLEVAFEHTCNFKCMYCSPDTSSKWMEEIEQHGPYETSWRNNNLDWIRQSGRMPIPHREPNPYLDAFWSWWPQLYHNLKVFRITGGEPLLSRNTWRVLDYIDQHPRPDLDIAINTNLGVPENLIDRLIEMHQRLEGKVRSFDVYTSCEAAGRPAEYIRFGMDYQGFMSNCRRVLSETAARLHFMITFNALSVTTFAHFLRDIWQLRVDHNPNDGINRIPMMIAYLRWPTFQSVKILPDELKERFAAEWRDYLMDHTRATSPHQAGRFYLEEIDQLERLIKFAHGDLPTRVREQRDFGIFYQEYDRRRGTDFAEIFPELSDFYHSCLAER